MSESTAIARVDAPQAMALHPREGPSFSELVSMGNDLVRTGFLPDHIKTGAQAAAIILTGRELGMQPMRALRSLQLVKGKVTENADSQLARFKTDGGRATFTDLTELRAVLWLRHPNGDEHTEAFTFENARAAGLTGPGGMYAKYPKAMLRSRVITSALKSVGWEGGAGAYDPDEIAALPTVSEPAPLPASEDVDAITEPQYNLLFNLLRSHVFSEQERVKILKKTTTKTRATDAIAWAHKEIEARKAVEFDNATANDAEHDTTPTDADAL